MEESERLRDFLKTTATIALDAVDPAVPIVRRVLADDRRMASNPLVDMAEDIVDSFDFDW
jgi:hypothetical protein